MVLIRTRRPGKTLPLLHFMILSCLMLLLCLSPFNLLLLLWSLFFFKNFCFLSFLSFFVFFEGVVGVLGSDGDSAFLRFFVFPSCILAGNVHPRVLRMCLLLFEGSEIPLSFFFHFSLFFFHTMYD